MSQLTRREFMAIAAVGAVGGVPRPAASLTAQQVVERIKQNLGAEWKTDGVDMFKAGDPATTVKGIVTTSMPTLSVLKQAVKNGANLLITSEPTFYSKADSSSPQPTRGRATTATAPPDPVFTAKNDFIKANGVVIWRFSDHLRLRNPDPFLAGLNETLGWGKRRIEANDWTRASIPPLTLDALASDVKKKLNIRGGIRVVGDPKLMVQKVGLLPGTTPIQSALALLPNVDVVIAGEVREWESVEYVRDKVRAGEKKALILIGRVISEEPGMNQCAQWIKTLVPGVPTTWVPVGDPYWRPS